jgi:hypothetical protein
MFCTTATVAHKLASIWHHMWANGSAPSQRNGRD